MKCYEFLISSLVLKQGLPGPAGPPGPNGANGDKVNLCTIYN